MITVERKRQLAAPIDRVRAVLTDIDHLDALIPRAEEVAVLSHNEGRARVAVTLRLGRWGTQRIEGEARLLPDGLRFVAVQPMQIDTVYKLVPRGAQTEMLVRVTTEVPKMFAKFTRFIPQRMIEERVGNELEAALDALAAAVGARGV